MHESGERNDRRQREAEVKEAGLVRRRRKEGCALDARARGRCRVWEVAGRADAPLEARVVVRAAARPRDCIDAGRAVGAKEHARPQRRGIVVKREHRGHCKRRPRRPQRAAKERKDERMAAAEESKPEPVAPKVVVVEPVVAVSCSSYQC